MTKKNSWTVQFVFEKPLSETGYLFDIWSIQGSGNFDYDLPAVLPQWWLPTFQRTLMVTSCSSVGGYHCLGEVKMEDGSSPRNVGNYEPMLFHNKE